MKINSRLETIFACAVAMDNRGLRNTIHCVGSLIYIINFDHSMILRFRLRKNEVAFQSSISFNANDYDSSDFDVVDDRIVFRTAAKGYERKKICRTSDYDVKQIRKVYRDHFEQGEHSPYLFYLSRECCSLLDGDLSHVEVSVQDGGLILRQRNVYDGTIVEVTPKKAGLLTIDKLPQTFGPVGMKTQDFTSLFTLYESLAFVPTEDYVIVKDQKGDFDGILAFCKYDEIINLRTEEGPTDGGQEPKIRRRK